MIGCLLHFEQFCRGVNAPERLSHGELELLFGDLVVELISVPGKGDILLVRERRLKGSTVKELSHLDFELHACQEFGCILTFFQVFVPGEVIEWGPDVLKFGN